MWDYKIWQPWPHQSSKAMYPCTVLEADEFIDELYDLNNPCINSRTIWTFLQQRKKWKKKFVVWCQCKDVTALRTITYKYPMYLKQ